MSALRTTLTALAVIVFLQTTVQAGEAPEAVKKWLKAQVGRWEVKGGVQPDQVGRHESELAAGGNVLVSKGSTADGSTFLSVEAWEADKGKLATTIYLSSGAYLRREEVVKGNEISGSVSGMDADGKPFGGQFSEKMNDDGTGESVYTGTLGGEKVSLEWTFKKVR